MNVEEKIISGIHNFCNSWCERCPFTQRCHSYQLQVDSGLNRPIDPNATLVQQLTEALALTRQYLDKIRPTTLSVTEQSSLEQRAVSDSTSNHPVSQLAQTYLRLTGDWLRDERGLLERAGYQQLHDVKLGIRLESEALDQLNGLKDAWETIRWYRTLIPVKTTSALRLVTEPTDNAELHYYYTGKAKLVLVSIDLSVEAWQTIMNYYPDKIDELLDILVLLSRISRSLETLFPGARAFRRPGFD